MAGIPQNCGAPLAHDMEMTAIPQILRLSPQAARIKHIVPRAGADAYEYSPGFYRIDCWVDVYWSNGTVDRMAKISLWEDRYGEFQGEYRPK
jgi:hypothetical protein